MRVCKCPKTQLDFYCAARELTEGLHEQRPVRTRREVYNAANLHLLVHVLQGLNAPNVFHSTVVLGGVGSVRIEIKDYMRVR